MKNYKIELLPKAQRDISNILDYIAVDLCAPLAALNLHEKIMEQFNRLKSFPLSGEIFQTDNIPLKYTYRRVFADNYIIFYTVDEPSQTIYIMHVVYAASNYLTLL